MAGPAGNLIDEDLRQLKQTLVPLAQLFDQLRELMLQEQEALKGRDVGALESLNEQIGMLLSRIQDADHLRQRLTVGLGKRLGMREEGLNLARLDEALGGGTGLLEMRKGLKLCIQNAEEANRENQAVFKGVLAATESILHALKSGAQGPTASYNRLGSRKVGSRFNLLNKQL